MKMNMNKEWCFLNTLTWKLFIMSDKVDGDVWTYTCTIMFVLLTFWNYYNKSWTWVKYCWKFSIFWIKLLKAFFPVLYENRGKAIQTCARPLIKAHCVSHHSNFNSIQSSNIYEIHIIMCVCVQVRQLWIRHLQVSFSWNEGSCLVLKLGPPALKPQLFSTQRLAVTLHLEASSRSASPLWKHLYSLVNVSCVFVHGQLLHYLVVIYGRVRKEREVGSMICSR